MFWLHQCPHTAVLGLAKLVLTTTKKEKKVHRVNACNLTLSIVSECTVLTVLLVL